MNLKLFYDFETTGFPLYSPPSGDPGQPHIVQLAAKLLDVDTRTTMAMLDLTIRPDGWAIPEDVSALHGIMTEHALQVGVPEYVALAALLALWSASNERVPHVESFDCRIGRIAIKRLLHDDALADDWKAAPAYCTANRSKQLEGAVSERGRSIKQPNLSEALAHFTGRVHHDAHRAMPDVGGGNQAVKAPSPAPRPIQPGRGGADPPRTCASITRPRSRSISSSSSSPAIARARAWRFAGAPWIGALTTSS